MIAVFWIRSTQFGAADNPGRRPAPVGRHCQIAMHQPATGRPCGYGHRRSYSRTPTRLDSQVNLGGHLRTEADRLPSPAAAMGFFNLVLRAGGSIR
jgi:hypothetical protein